MGYSGQYGESIARLQHYSDAGRFDKAMEAAVDMVTRGAVPTLVPFLGGLFRLRGLPYNLDEHFQFEPLFATEQVESIIYKTGRQIGKTQSMCVSAALRAALVPNYRMMFVTPLYTQIQRISNDYMRPLLRESPIGHMTSDVRVEASVLRRTFFNQSRIEFTFASLNADRVRGSSNDEILIDEIQDMRSDHIPVILESKSASKRYGLIRKFGTPKTPENTIEGEWRTSSQGVWCIPCPACKKDNLACKSQDLTRMLGPPRPDISLARPGTICAKCGRPIFPHTGFFVHNYPELRTSRLGYHVPQPIMPLHYSSAKKWSEMMAKKEGANFFTPSRFDNEVLGESAGEGQQLITLEQLRSACDGDRVNDPKTVRKIAASIPRNKYRYKMLAVDWGGGGESGLSLTVPAVLGLTRSNKIDVLYACRLYTPNDHYEEARQLLGLFKLFDCDFMSHDYTGAGVVRESIMQASGVSKRLLVPVQYVGGGQNSLMTKVKATHRSMRTYFRLNKSRSLLNTCMAIRTGNIRFFRYDYVGPDNPGLIHDFLALYEERIEHKSGSNVYLVARNQASTDDFAQAVNIGCSALWYMTKSWPTFKVDPKYNMTAQQEEELEPDYPFLGQDEDDGSVLDEFED